MNNQMFSIYSNNDIPVRICSLNELITAINNKFDFSNYSIITFKDEIHDHLDLLDNLDYLEIEFDDIKIVPNNKNVIDIFPYGELIAKYIKQSIKNSKIILCQCVYGRSRSAGCASAILEYYFKKGYLIKNDSNYDYNQIVYNAVLNSLINC